MTESVDVVVVGSGAGGGPVALELSRAGAKVVVLEKGRDVPMEELLHDELEMNRRPFFVPSPDDEPHTLRYGEQAHAVRTDEGWTSNIVGGGTVHFSGYFLRMKPVDMRLLSWMGPVEGARVADWPISYDDLEPYYTKTEQEIGVSGRWKTHPFEEPRSRDYPLPPLLEHPISSRIDAACAALGLHSFPTARAILSRPHNGRQGCVYCSLCSRYGCPIGAKGSTNAALLPRAVATGRCEVRARCMAVEVTVDASDRATGVVYRDADEQLRFIGARCVVLACSAVETARLLLLSRSARFQNGLANGNGLVGRNAVFSGLSLGAGIFQQVSRSDRKWMTDRTPFVNRSVQDLYQLDTPVDGVSKGGTIEFALSHANPIANALSTARRAPFAESDVVEDWIWGVDLKRRLAARADRRVLRFETFCEFLANPGTYVDLDPAVRDRWGYPAARLTITPHAMGQRAARLLADTAISILERMGADEVAITTPQGETKFLQGGTCRFGADPETSVLDPSCRAHEVQNLYVTDGSFLPTSGGVPNTMTIMANAFRVADVVAARFRAREL